MQFANRGFHDRTGNRTGVKVGDYGTGGRTYSTTHRVKRGDGDNAFRFGGGGGFPFCLILTLALGVLLWSERSLSGKLAVLSVVEEQAVSLNDTLARPSLDGSIVHVQGRTPKVVHEAQALTDDYFGYAFTGSHGAAVQVKSPPRATLPPAPNLLVTSGPAHPGVLPVGGNTTRPPHQDRSRTRPLRDLCICIR